MRTREAAAATTQGTGLRTDRPALEPGLPDSEAVRHRISAARAAPRGRMLRPPEPMSQAGVGPTAAALGEPRAAAAAGDGAGAGRAWQSGAAASCSATGWATRGSRLLPASGPQARGLGWKLSESLPGTRAPVPTLRPPHYSCPGVRDRTDPSSVSCLRSRRPAANKMVSFSPSHAAFKKLRFRKNPVHG